MLSKRPSTVTGIQAISTQLQSIPNQRRKSNSNNNVPNNQNQENMSGPAVLLIGASGFMGAAVSQAFLAQKSKFKKIGVLAVPEKADKFKEVEAQGMEIVIGSSTDSSSYQGKLTRSSFGSACS